MQPSGLPTRVDARDSHEEDYRRSVLRKNVPKLFFYLFNLTLIGKISPNLHFIAPILFPKAIIQNLVLLVAALPVY